MPLAPTAPATTTYTDGPGLSMTRYTGDPAAAQAPAPAPSLYSAYPQTAASMSAARRSAPMPSMPLSDRENYFANAPSNERNVMGDIDTYRNNGPSAPPYNPGTMLPPMLPGAPLSQAMPTPAGTHFPTDPLARARMGLDTMSPRDQADLSYRMGVTPNPAPAPWTPGQTPSWASAGFGGNNPGPVHKTPALPYTGAIGPTPSGAALGSPSLGGGYGPALPTAPAGRVTTRTPLPNGGYTTTVTGGGPAAAGTPQAGKQDQNERKLALDEQKAADVSAYHQGMIDNRRQQIANGQQPKPLTPSQTLAIYSHVEGMAIAPSAKDQMYQQAGVPIPQRGKSGLITGFAPAPATAPAGGQPAGLPPGAVLNPDGTMTHNGIIYRKKQ